MKTLDEAWKTVISDPAYANNLLSISNSADDWTDDQVALMLDSIGKLVRDLQTSEDKLSFESAIAAAFQVWFNIGILCGIEMEKHD